MKLILLGLGLMFCLLSCDNRQLPVGNNFESGRFIERKIDFVRYKDTLGISFLLDTAYYPIGYSIGMICSDGYKGFANGIDTILILSYDIGSVGGSCMDTVEIRRHIMTSLKGENRQTKNLIIEKESSVVKLKHYDFYNKNILMNCGILDTIQKVSLLLQLCTQKIDPENELVFNVACNSFKYKTRKKN